MTDEIKIIMADDHPIVRQGLRLIIESDEAFSVIAEAGDGESALRLIEIHRPDVAILDIDMPKMDGFAVVRAIREKNLAVAIIFLTMHGEEELFQSAMDLAVIGYVLKDSAGSDILKSINSVAKGQPYLSPALSAHILNRRRRNKKFDEENPGLQSLSPTERRILKMIAEEKTSKEIAAELFISYRTVETHRSNICKKLDLHGGLALVKFAVIHKSEL